MIRKVTLPLLLIVAGVSGVVLMGGESQATARLGCPNTVEREPVLMRNTSGFVATGPLQEQFVVYSDGLVSFSRISGVGPPVIESWTNYVPVLNVRNLLRGVEAAGASQLCDQLLGFSDAPRSTTTIFHGATDAVAHTYSDAGNLGAYYAVRVTISNFIQASTPP